MEFNFIKVFFEILILYVMIVATMLLCFIFALHYDSILKRIKLFFVEDIPFFFSLIIIWFYPGDDYTEKWCNYMKHKLEVDDEKR